MEKRCRAFTVKPFWALLIMAGRKDVENRTFRAPPGRYLVHASRGYSYAEHRACLDWIGERMRPDFAPTWEACAAAAGKILGGVEVAECVTVCLSPWWDGERVAWVLREPRQIEPVEVTGALGLWKVGDATRERVREARARWLERNGGAERA